MVWLTAEFLAGFQIVIHCLLEGRAQFGDTLAVRADDVTNAGNAANKAPSSPVAGSQAAYQGMPVGRFPLTMAWESKP